MGDLHMDDNKKICKRRTILNILLTISFIVVVLIGFFVPSRIVSLCYVIDELVTKSNPYFDSYHSDMVILLYRDITFICIGILSLIPLFVIPKIKRKYPIVYDTREMEMKETKTIYKAYLIGLVFALVLLPFNVYLAYDGIRGVFVPIGEMFGFTNFFDVMIRAISVSMLGIAYDYLILLVASIIAFVNAKKQNKKSLEKFTTNTVLVNVNALE